MKKLIHVVRGRPDTGIAFHFFTENGDIIRTAVNPMAVQVKPLPPAQYDADSLNYARDCDVFLVDERDVEVSLQNLTANNPGCEVRVYGLEQVAQCPAAAMVVKNVSEYGVLPAASEKKKATIVNEVDWAVNPAREFRV